MQPPLTLVLKARTVPDARHAASPLSARRATRRSPERPRPAPAPRRGRGQGHRAAARCLGRHGGPRAPRQGRHQGGDADPRAGCRRIARLPAQPRGALLAVAAGSSGLRSIVPDGDTWFTQTLRDGIREGAAPFAPALAIEFRTYGSAEDQALLLSPARAARLRRADRRPGRFGDHRGAARGGRPTRHAGRLDRRRLARQPPRAVGLHRRLQRRRAGRRVDGTLSCRGAAKWPSSARAVGSRAHAEQVRGFGTSLSRLSARVKLAAVIESHADERETQRRVRDLLHAHPRLKGLYISASHALPVLQVRRARGPVGRTSPSSRPTSHRSCSPGSAAARSPRPCTSGR